MACSVCQEGRARPEVRRGSLPEGARKVSRGSTVCWGDSTGTKYPEESWELTKYLFTPEALEAYWQILWVAPPSRLSVVTSDAFKNITGLTAGGIDYPGIDSEEEFDRVEGWIVTTLTNGWDTQECLGDNSDDPGTRDECRD